MILTRRRFLAAGGGCAAILGLHLAGARADAPVEIVMQGRADGSHVWFDPVGILVKPGQTIRWINRDPGNSHSTTAYSPENFDRPLRMPKGSRAWNSDLLLPGQTFSVTFTEKGVYDYYCIPHEHAGMVGRIVVGEPEPHGWMELAGANGELPGKALQAFPSVEDIMRKGAVRRA
ncbi:plastocyanin/azurin family copper-binding protein [Mesorhizobium sp. L-8-3]|uniref:plastocyanin/azurin family copper-binding protein n=1 Tax=Mesorhizobium sp. L-8-3 TaxID=2744522 RepID=UPI0019267C36|nr:plastocyanin/azurin family copper-binding protein [Mesorhizobium sp. L-8-3]BCH25491.1 plastocyanin [Mesorhizobium sp. L-8-3]